MTDRQKTKNFSSTVNSLMIAIIITSSFIAKFFASFGLVEEGLIPVMLIMSLITSYVAFFITRKKKLIIHKKSLVLVCFIIIAFLLTLIFRGLSSFGTNYFIDFLAFGIIVYLLTLLPYSSYKIIYYTMLLGNLILLNPIGFIDFISLEYSYESVDMGASYAILPSIVATIIYMFFIKNIRKHKFTIFSYLSNSILLVLLITEGTRGAVASILLLLIVIIYIKMRLKVIQGVSYVYPIIYTFIIALISISIFNLSKILIWVLNVIQKSGISIATITKTINMVEDKGVIGFLNKRDVVYEQALGLFKRSPILGNGIGSYGDMYHGTYPHNLILQLLVEGGLIFTLPFLFIIVHCILAILKPWPRKLSINDSRMLILFLFIVCIPKLMLSSYLWREQTFWLLIFLVLGNYTKLSNVDNEKNVHD